MKDTVKLTNTVEIDGYSVTLVFADNADSSVLREIESMLLSESNSAHILQHFLEKTVGGVANDPAV